MKLSDAILKGSEQRPQCTGQLFSVLADGTIGSCALGAAYEGTFGFGIVDYHAELALRKAYPELQKHSPYSLCLEETITQMNDLGGRTREQIAAWLAEQGL